MTTLIRSQIASSVHLATSAQTLAIIEKQKTTRMNQMLWTVKSDQTYVQLDDSANSMRSRITGRQNQ
jgi:hypothetical protein